MAQGTFPDQQLVDTAEPEGKEDWVVVGRFRYSKGVYGALVTVLGGLMNMFTLTDYVVFGLSLPIIIKALHLSTTVGLQVASILSISVLISGFIVGPLADHFGRLRVLRVWMLVAGAFSAATGLSATVWEFVVTRFVAATTIHTQVVTGALVNEEAHPRHRGLSVGFQQGLSQFSATVVGLVAVVLLPGNWRWFFAVFFIPVLILFGLSFLLRETPQFEALRAARKSGRDKHALGSQLLQLFSSRSLAKQTIMCWLWLPLIQFGQLALGILGPLYLVQFNGITIQQAASITAFGGIVAIVAQIGTGWLSDHIAPKLIMVVVAICGGLTMLLIARPHAGFAYYFVVMSLYTLFIQAMYGVAPRYITGSFPSRIRTTAFSTTHALSDSVAAFLLPLLEIGFISGHIPGALFLLSGGLVIIGGLILWGLGAPMAARAELVEDVEPAAVAPAS